jgi:hypothetical protein
MMCVKLSKYALDQLSHGENLVSERRSWLRLFLLPISFDPVFSAYRRSLARFIMWLSFPFGAMQAGQICFLKTNISSRSSSKLSSSSENEILITGIWGAWYEPLKYWVVLILRHRKFMAHNLAVWEPYIFAAKDKVTMLIKQRSTKDICCWRYILSSHR